MIIIKIYYIGRFPPPYGGVTIKNKIIYDSLGERIKIYKFDLIRLKHFNIINLIIFIFIIINKNNKFIIGSAATSRKLISRILYFFNNKALKKSLLFVMGGIASNTIVSDINYTKWVSCYKQVYVETNGMRNTLLNVGLKNVSVFPNCRKKTIINLSKANKKNKVLKLLYFSLISKEKGVDLIFEASKILIDKGIDFNLDFYGHLDVNYEKEFFIKIKNFHNLKYNGIFNSINNNVYEKLVEYDLLLFPTLCKSEGVAGILVESKISGLPVIASNINYNPEIVSNGMDGIILKENTSAELANAIINLYSNRELITKMKFNSIISSEKYIIDNYIDSLVRIILDN